MTSKSVLGEESIDNRKKLKEIEEDRSKFETRIVNDPYEILARTKHMVDASKGYSISSVSGGLLYAYNHAFDDFARILEKHCRGEHEGVRWLTTLDRDCLEAAKKFLELGMEIRHSSSIPAESFGFSEKEVGVTVSRLEGGQLNASALFSDDPMYIDHYRKVFDERWNDSVDAGSVVKDIENGIEEPKLKVVRNPAEIRATYLRLLNQATSEILMLLPSANSYRRGNDIGSMRALQSAITERNVKVRLLTPLPVKEVISDLGIGIKNTSNALRKDEEFSNVREIREATSPNTVSVIIADGSSSLTVELLDDTKTEFNKAIGLATYSTRGPTVSANVRFFERMWEEAESRERERVLLEKEKKSRKEAELLQDILAHDIRNYNQISLTSAELLKSEGRLTVSQESLVNEILDSVERSSELVERAKKLGRILSQEESPLHPVHLTKVIERSIEIVTRANPDRRVIFDKSVSEEAIVLADDFLIEAFVNILSNSLMYSAKDEPDVEIIIESFFAEEGHSEGNHSYWKVSFIDHGKGISDDLKKGAFKRYMETAHGSGLGLSIVYALVVERYRGRVEIKNRVESDYRKGTIVNVFLKSGSKSP